MIYMELENKDYAMHKVMKYLTKIRENNDNNNTEKNIVYSKKLKQWINVMVGGGFEEKYIHLLETDVEFSSLVRNIKSTGNFNPINRLITLFNNYHFTTENVPINGKKAIGRKQGARIARHLLSINHEIMSGLINRTIINQDNSLRLKKI